MMWYISTLKAPRLFVAQHEKVFAVDIVPSKVNMVNQRKSPIQDEYIEKYLAEKDLDYVNVDRILEEERRKSFDFLKDALTD